MDALCETLYFDEDSLPVLFDIIRAVASLIQNLQKLSTTLLPNESLPWLPIVSSLQHNLAGTITDHVKSAGRDIPPTAKC